MSRRGRSSGPGAERRAAVVRAVTDLGVAELVPDPDRPRAWTLTVDGTPQSHVDLDDPTYLEFEYVRRLGHLADLAGEPGRPLNVLHLGGGAWTLARYVAATRPGSRQRVVELDGALAEFVRERLPDAGSGIRVRTGDAREVLHTLGDGTVDLLVTDVYAGARIPAHLTTAEFAGQAARVLRPGGTYAANVADGGPLGFARAQAATLAALWPHVAVIGPAQVLRGRRFGNLVLAASRLELSVSELSRRVAGDPFPARLVAGEELTRFVAGASPVTDEQAAPSPLPPLTLLDRPGDPD